jgi:prefoldin subunit 2
MAELNPRLVLATLRPLLTTAPTRKCYRQIGGTLVERTVADVVPSLETNYSGIKEVLEGLAKSYQGREKAFVEFQKEYGIQVSLVMMDDGGERGIRIYVGDSAFRTRLWDAVLGLAWTVSAIRSRWSWGLICLRNTRDPRCMAGGR